MERSFSSLKGKKRGKKRTVSKWPTKKEEKTWQNDGNDRCSNRCSRVLGACTTCYRGARIRFKTIRCGWACLPLPLSAVLQPGTRERGREFSVASAKPHHHVPRLRAFQEFKNSRSRGVSLMMNARPTGNPFSSSFVRGTFTAIFFLPRFFVVRALPFIRVMHHIGRGSRAINNPYCVSCTFLMPTYHIRSRYGHSFLCNRIIRRIVRANIGFASI